MIAIAKALVILTFISIFWIPKSVLVSATGLRPEDFIGFISIIFFPIYYINTYNKINPKLLLSLFIYSFYILIISLIRNPEHLPNILILFSKEISYFSSFFIFFYVFNRLVMKKTKFFLLILLYITIPPIFYGLYQIITLNFTGIYGISLYGHEQSPASNGLLFLFIFIFMMICSKSVSNIKINKFVLAFSGLLVLLTGSKIAVLGMISFIFFHFFYRSKFREKLVGIISIGLGIISIFYLAASNTGAFIRYSGFLNPIQVIKTRGIWYKVEWVDGIVGNITGMGLAAGHVNSNGEFSMGMAMDNFYLYCYIVLGFFGTLFFILVLWNLFRSFPLNTLEKNIFISFFVSFLGKGMGAEIFQLSISGLMFWSMSGTLLGLSKNKNWMCYKKMYIEKELIFQS